MSARTVTRLKMFKTSLCISSLCALTASAQNEQGGSAVIKMPNNHTGPYFNLSLPHTIYQHSRDAALSDLRIRNAKGEFLHYAWLDVSHTAKEPREPNIARTTVPIFPLSARVNTANLSDESISMQLEKSSDGSLRLKTSIQTLPKPSSATATWIIDASRITSSKSGQQAIQLLQLNLRIPTDYQGIAEFELDASDDLQHWRTIETHGQVVQIKHQGELIERHEFPLTLANTSSNQAHYLRLRWRSPASAPFLKSADVDFQQQAEDSGPVAIAIQWHDAISPLTCSTHICEYAVPRNTPIDSLRINIQEPNTLAKIKIIAQRENDQSAPPTQRQSRNPLYHLRHKNHPAPPRQATEYVIAESTIYRLQKGDVEISANEIALSGQAYTKLKLHVDNGIASLGQTPPSIAIANMARSLTFLARGAAPYSLHWGAQSKAGAALSRSELIPDIRLANNEHAWATITLDATPNTPTASPRAEKTTQEKPKQIWLWLAFGAAITLLGAMVFSLLRNMDQSKSE